MSPGPHRALRRLVVGLLLAVAVVLGAPEPASTTGSDEQGSAAEWNRFRDDPRLLGIAQGGLGEDLAPRWMFEAGDGIESTAAIVDGTVYVGSLDGNLYALELDSGREVWRYAADSMIKSSPTVWNGTVYFGDEAGTFHAVSASSGERLWSHTTGAGIVSTANLARVGEGAGGRTVLLFGSYDNRLYCLAAEDGSVLWEVETDGYVNGTPAVVDGRVVSVGCDGVLRVIRLRDGEVLQEVSVDAYVGASPAIRDDVAYFGTFANRVLAVALDTGERLWAYEHPERKFPYYSSAAVTEELVVVGGRDKMVHALDRRTGAPVWVHMTRARIDGSPVIVGDRAFVGAGAGEVVALELDDGDVAWRFETGSSIAASPAVAAGRLVIGTEDGQLYCFG